MRIEAVLWWVIKALLGIAFVVSLTRTVGGSIWLGLTIGSALAFVAALEREGADDASSEADPDEEGSTSLTRVK